MSQGSPIHCFGDVEINTLTRAVYRGGCPIYLRQQTFEVLLHLFAHRARVVTKGELMTAVWKNTAVTDDALTQCIKEIRKALGDDSRQPRFIRTAPRVGYHFVGAVDEPPTEVLTTRVEEVRSVEVSVEEEEEEEVQGPGRFRVDMSTFAGIAIVLALGIVGYVGWRTLAVRPLADGVALSAAGGQRGVVVMFLENQSRRADLDWLREGLADMLITNLARSPQLAVLGRERLATLLARRGLNGADRIELDAAIDLARTSHADLVVLGAFASVGETLRVDLRVYDTKTGQLTAAEQLAVSRSDRILTDIDLLATRLVGRLGAAPRDTAQGAPTEGLTNNLEAYRDYSLGLEKAQTLHPQDAIEHFERALALDRGFVMASARIGYTYAMTLDQGSLAKPYLENAFRHSARLTERDRLSIRAWYAVGNEDFAAAIRIYQEILARYPNEVEAYWRLGRLLAGEERFDEALVLLTRGLAVDPDSTEIYNQLGQVDVGLGRFDDAIAAQLRYVALAPVEPNAYDSLGLAYQAKGDYASALAAYGRAIELDPQFEIAVVHRGNVYFQRGQYQRALEEYARSLRLAKSDDGRVRSYYQTAWVLFKRGDLERAWAAVRNGQKWKEKSRSWVSFLIADARHDARAAAANAETVLSRGSRGQRVSSRREWFWSGVVALRESRSEEALDHLKEALRHRASVWDMDWFDDCLADAYLELGRLDEAIAEYDRVLKAKPYLGPPRFHLAQAYEQKKDWRKARREYERFLEVWRDADRDVPEVVTAERRSKMISGSLRATLPDSPL